MYIYAYVLLHACVLFKNRFALTKHPNPAPTTSNPPSVPSPTQAGTRHTLRTAAHPRTAKVVGAADTVRCSRKGSAEAAPRLCDWMRSQ